VTKTLRRALVRLAREKIVASTSSLFDDLCELGFAESLGLIPTPGAVRCTSMRAGYKITEAGAARASLYDEDGRPKMLEET
jgi:hypothetical protein